MLCTRGLRRCCLSVHRCVLTRRQLTDSSSQLTESVEYELNKEHLYDSKDNELPLYRFLKHKEERTRSIEYVDQRSVTDYYVARHNGELDITEVEDTDVLGPPLPVRTVINKVYGDYNKIVEDILEHLKAKEDHPPSYIHIDPAFCRLLVPGQFADTIRQFLETKF